MMWCAEVLGMKIMFGSGGKNKVAKIVFKCKLS